MRRDAGLSLIEVVIATGILGVAMALTGTALVKAQRATSDALARERATQIATNALAVLVSDLRSTGASEVMIDASPEGAAEQRIRFRTMTGIDATTQMPVWSATQTVYWYDAARRQLKRQQGLGSISIVGAGIDPTVRFGLAGEQVGVTLSATVTLASDGDAATVAVTERVALFN
jgi:prepilin-type N-terminal cleavage/methylation domain-containing protein